MAEHAPGGFVPPPYPHDRLGDLHVLADAVPGGAIDCSIGTPVDPMPEVALRALADAAPMATGYPPSIGTPELRDAASRWVTRRLGVEAAADEVIACVGTKEVVASLPRLLSLRDPTRDTVLFPGVSYPTYAMGAELAGLRSLPIPVDDAWRPQLSAVDRADADRALVVWLNDPANPTGATATAEEMRAAIDWARARGAIVASDECYAEFTYDTSGAPAAPVSALVGGPDGVLAVHSLSKRSNMAGLRVGFIAGDRGLVRYLGEVRKHAGFMVPLPVQHAAAAALEDDEHVDAQRARYARRRAALLPALEAWGLVHDGGPSTFYLWLRTRTPGETGWSIAKRLAGVGVLAAPGDLYGDAGTEHVRLALSITDEQTQAICDRLAAAS
jgi:succinyldiaminopimelate transaminase